MTLSPSVVQLFSMKPASIVPPCTPPRSQTSDSGIESVKSKKQGRPANFNNSTTHASSSNFRGRGNSDPAVKKHLNANNTRHFSKAEKQRASSLSPTKNLHTSSTSSPKTAKKANYQKPTGTSKSLTFQAGRTPPRFGNGFKKQHSAPTGSGSKSSSHLTAIHTTPSSPTFRKKPQTSTAMKTKNNNHPHPKEKYPHSKNQDSDSGSASSGSYRSKPSSTKTFVRTASLHNNQPGNQSANESKTPNANSRQRNDNSFSGTIYRDEMWAGSAASPAATALPQPPIAWLKIKEEAAGREVEVEASMNMESMLKAKEKSSEIQTPDISARNATTTKSPLATSVQQMFASFNSPMVSTTA